MGRWARSQRRSGATCLFFTSELPGVSWSDIRLGKKSLSGPQTHPFPNFAHCACRLCLLRHPHRSNNLYSFEARLREPAPPPTSSLYHVPPPPPCIGHHLRSTPTTLVSISAAPTPPHHPCIICRGFLSDPVFVRGPM